MNKDEVVQSLIGLGLTTGEAKTYVTLVVEGPHEATPLAAAAGIPQPRIYEFLRTLAEKNLIMEYETNKRAKSYEAVDYNIALDLLVEELNQKAQSSRDYFKANIESTKSDDQSLFSTKIGDNAIRVAVEDICSKSTRNMAYTLNNQHAGMITELVGKYKLQKFELIPIETIASIGVENYGDLFQIVSKVLLDISSNQPSYLISDIDLDQRTARLLAFIIPRDELLEPMIVIIKHPVIIDYIVKLYSTVRQAIFNNLKPSND